MSAQVILDGNFIFTSLKFKIDLRNRLETLLQGSTIKFYVLRSIYNEMEIVGAKALKSLEFVKTFCEIIEDNCVDGASVSEKYFHLLRKSVIFVRTV